MHSLHSLSGLEGHKSKKQNKYFHMHKTALHLAKQIHHNILVFSDGGFRDVIAVGGWIAYSVGVFGAKALAAQGFKVPPLHDSFVAEAIALEMVASFILDCLNPNTCLVRPTAHFSIS